VPQPTRRPSSREAALVELQRLHAAIQASRQRRGLLPTGTPATVEGIAARELTRRLQSAAPAPDLALETAAPASGSRRGVWLLVAAAVLVAGVWAGLTFSQRRGISSQAAAPLPRPASPAPGAGAPSASAAGAPATAAPAADPPAPARAVRLSLETLRPVWLLVTVDGKRAYRDTAAAGERLTFNADRAILVRSGDAGGVRVTLNGTDRGAMGLRGWPLTVSITRDGVEPLTPTRPEP
jgi:cytoskeleton protein RodZ